MLRILLVSVADWLSTVRGMNCVKFKPCFDGKAIKRRLFKMVSIIKTLDYKASYHHHHVPEGLGVFPAP